MRPACLPSLLSAGVALALAASVQAAPARAAIADTLEAMAEKVLGAADAPVTMIEYASLTCSHCAHFHNAVLPALRERYIETGKLRLIYRDFPLDHYAVRAAQLARCNSEAKYFPFLKVLYMQQERWTKASDPLVALVRLARLSGMDGQEFKQCVGNKGLEDAILRQRLEGAKAYSISSTPTLILNGEKYTGGHEVEAIAAEIERALDDAGIGNHTP